ncbi:hypothetical protein [Neobacillus vireti]|uniref:hypothetical protein n=1 Tax=Neobacillus vireti TaxID=220686 RepID=UPI002FFE23B5
MTTGDTTEKKNQPMLEMKFDNLHADGLVIKKVMKTKNGLISIDMIPNESVNFKNLSVKITNADLAEPYLPKNGNIGLKNVKLLAHNVTTDSSALPKLNVSFSSNGVVEMEPKNEQELIQTKDLLEQILNTLNP